MIAALLIAFALCCYIGCMWWLMAQLEGLGIPGTWAGVMAFTVITGLFGGIWYLAAFR